MPVTDSVNVVFKALPLVINADASGVCVFRRSLADGTALGQIEMQMSTAEVMAALGKSAPAGMTVLDYLTGALYQLGVDKGLLHGAIS